MADDCCALLGRAGGVAGSEGSYKGSCVRETHYIDSILAEFSHLTCFFQWFVFRDAPLSRWTWCTSGTQDTSTEGSSQG